jgi:hypothetical protein
LLFSNPLKNIIFFLKGATSPIGLHGSLVSVNCVGKLNCEEGVQSGQEVKFKDSNCIAWKNLKMN